MKAQDWADAENYRNHIISELFEFCASHGLDATAGEKKLTIKLPTIKEISVMPEVERVKRFDVSTWGERGIDETTDIVADNMPDELPPANYTLEEGVPPKGDDEDDTESK